MALLSGTPPLGTTGPVTLRLLATTAEAGPAWHIFTLTFTEGAADPHAAGFAPALSITGGNLHFEWFGHNGYSYQIRGIG
jgi:hypothetical protein